MKAVAMNAQFKVFVLVLIPILSRESAASLARRAGDMTYGVRSGGFGAASLPRNDDLVDREYGSGRFSC